MNFWNKVILINEKEKKEFAVGSDGKIVIPALKEGTYNIVWSSRFGQSKKKAILLSKNRQIKFRLEKKLKKINPKIFSKELSNKDTLYILHNASGMSVDAREIRITKNENQFYGLYYEKGLFLQSMILNDNQIQFLSKTEEQATKVETASGCSVIESYTFCLKGKYYSVNDRTCSWGGFNALFKKIFD